jgi:outer membrane protein assembly factor BamB
VAYVSSDNGKLSAYRLDGGTRLWEFPVDGAKLKLQGLYGTPSVETDTIYLTGYDGSVVAIGAADGSQRWQHKVGDRVIGGALMHGDTVYAGTDGGELVALDRVSGSERWRKEAGNQIWSTPVTDGTTIFVAVMDGRISAFNTDGSLRWQEKVADAAIAGTPALADGVLYAGSFDKRLYAIDAANGSIRWRSEAAAGNWFWTEPLIDRDTVIAGSLDGSVYAVDRESGAQRWRTKVDAPVRARLAVVDTTVVVPTGKGLLWGLKLETGEPAWQPAIVGGKLYADLARSGSDLYLASEVGKSGHKLYRVDAATGSVKEIPFIK